MVALLAVLVPCVVEPQCYGAKINIAVVQRCCLNSMNQIKKACKYLMLSFLSSHSNKQELN